jgi:hypothetical protein
MSDNLGIKPNYRLGLIIFLGLLSVAIFSFVVFGVKKVESESNGVTINNTSTLLISEEIIATSTAPIIKMKPKKITVKGIYLTAYSAASVKKVDNIIKSIKNSEINAVVIDIKDYSGYISYDSNLELVNKLGLERPVIKDLPGVIKKFHDNKIYVIARLTVFQDPILATKKPAWSVLNSATGGSWRDNKGLGWVDPSRPEVWKYIADLGREAIGLGFDEINLDYVRFPSDGKISLMVFPGKKKGETKADVIKNFSKYFYNELKNEPAYLSADLFGFVTTVTNDMNIGQLIENAAPYFDYICPMVYPSHYPNGYMGFANPATHPYEVIFKAVKTGRERIEKVTSSIAVIRPWIQDFNMGAVYDSSMIKKEIKANKDGGGVGYLVWDPKNIYTWGAFR